jgi:hypothetical protein
MTKLHLSSIILNQREIKSSMAELSRFLTQVDKPLAQDPNLMLM